MRWKILGMRARGDRITTTVALRVLGPGGNTVLDEPRYVSVDQDFTYRPYSFFIPMSGHITLPAEFPKGPYTAQFMVTDEVAGAQIQHSATFDMR